MLFHWSLLRENPWFWRSAGGYPVWERELVGAGYFPLALAYVLLVLAQSWLVLLRPPGKPGAWWTEATIVFFFWTLMAVILSITLANNLSNLLEGRPFHEHPLL